LAVENGADTTKNATVRPWHGNSCWPNQQRERPQLGAADLAAAADRAGMRALHGVKSTRPARRLSGVVQPCEGKKGRGRWDSRSRSSEGWQVGGGETCPDERQRSRHAARPSRPADPGRQTRGGGPRVLQPVRFLRPQGGYLKNFHWVWYGAPVSAQIGDLHFSWSAPYVCQLPADGGGGSVHRTKPSGAQDDHHDVQ
jgi:hypothetical protein